MHAREALLLTMVFAGAAAPAAAIQTPEDPGRPNFDARRGEVADVSQKTAAARDAVVARLGHEGSVDTDPLSGGVRSLGRTDGLLTRAQPGDAAAIGMDYLRGHQALLGLDGSDLDALVPAARYTSPNGVTHVTWQQTSRGLPSFDGLITVNVAEDGRIVNVTSTATHDLDIASTAPAVGASSALAIAREDAGGLMLAPRARTAPGVEQRTRFTDGDTARLVAFADPDGDRLAWRLTVTGEDPYVYDTVVDARTGAVLARHGLTEFVSSASVWDYHPGATLQATPHTVDLAADPQWMNRSTLTTPNKLDGRNTHTYADFRTGDGFNGADVLGPSEDVDPSSGTDWVYAQAGVACASGSPSNFTGICTWSGVTATRAGEPTNRAQTTTQLFYLVNKFHDWLAAPPIGFTDASHNFEMGGTGGDDPLNAEADDFSGFNNANMNTPVDGNRPRMQMYLFTNPVVNSGDDATVVYHEYTHGLSNRLHNNGLGSGLVKRQSRAMGEGWSDWYALDYLVDQGLITDTPADGDIATGEYVTNNADRGIRRNGIDCSVGSADATACPGTASAGTGGFTFGDLGKVGTYGTTGGGDVFHRFNVHDDGEIWSETLWQLRTAIGGAAARTLVTEAMRLAPASPSFLDERDAILLADQVAGGTHRDQIWAVFASRGMGYSARTPSADATRVTAATDLPPATAATADRITVTDPAPLGDGDSVAEPGETVRLKVRLRNPGAAPLTGVSATLATTAPTVTVGQPTVTYPDINTFGQDTGNIPFALTLPAALPCAPVTLSLAVHTNQGDATLPLTLKVGAMGGGTAYTATGVPANIGDAAANGQIFSGAAVPVNVPAAGTVDHLLVTFSTDHTRVGDLHARITAPDGTFAEVFERPGDNGGYSMAEGMTAVVFDDDAATAVQDIPGNTGSALPALTGAFRPAEAFAKFDGLAQQGEWKVRVFDALNGGDGAVTGFSVRPSGNTLQCASNAPAPPTLSTAAATGLTQTDATLNGSVDPGTVDTAYQFEYGTSASYGQTTTEATATAGSGASTPSAALSGLSAGTTYHYRMVGRRDGTVIAVTPDATFTTVAAPTPTPNPTASATATPTATPTATAVAASVTGLPKTLKVDKQRRLKFAFRAAPAGAKGTIALATVKAKKAKSLKLGSASFTVGADGKVAVTLKIKKGVVGKLRKRKKVKVAAAITIGSTPFQGTAKLKVAKPKKR